MPTDRPRSRLLGALRLIAVLALVVGLAVVSRPTPLSVTAGFVIAAFGEALRIWASGHLTKTVDLVTSGPYRYTRNPMYLGRLLIFTGLCVMARLPYSLNLVVLVLGYAVFFGYYLPRKERVEPVRLRETHGEAYEHYRRAVPALLPTATPYPVRGGRGWSSERMLRNREHWMLLGTLVVTLVMLWRAYVR